MLMPKKLKHRKAFRGNRRGIDIRGSALDFGHYGLKAMEPSWVTARQIEAARRAITRHIKRGGEVWIRIFLDKPVTAKPLEVGMGGGKGSLDPFVAVVHPGRVLFEMDGVSENVAREALRLAARKLPLQTRFVKKEEFGAKGHNE